MVIFRVRGENFNTKIIDSVISYCLVICNVLHLIFVLGKVHVCKLINS